MEKSFAFAISPKNENVMDKSLQNCLHFLFLKFLLLFFILRCDSGRHRLLPLFGNFQFESHCLQLLFSPCANLSK